MIIRRMEKRDLNETSLIHKKAFIRQHHSYQWLECNLNAFPRIFCYVAIDNDTIVGYIIWSQKSGFRSEVILELEQIAVSEQHRGNGVGQSLISQSLVDLKNYLMNQGSILKHITVTTRADNQAQNLYKRTLGAEVEATISNLYSADEVFMVARNV